MRTTILGTTGLCGSGYLKSAESSPFFSKVFSLTRRALQGDHPNVESIVETDVSKWADKLPEADILFTSLSTTRAAANGLENQYKIDHDLNIELAEAALEKGYTTAILVSSVGANSNSYFPYLRLKGDVERDLIALGFKTTIILRPGFLIGEREGIFKGFGAKFTESLGSWIYRSPIQAVGRYPCHGDDVGRAAVLLASSMPPGIHIIESQQILELCNPTDDHKVDNPK